MPKKCACILILSSMYICTNFCYFLQKISENQKKKDGRELEFSEKCERIIAYWNFLSSDPIAKRLDTPTQADRVKKLIR